MRKHFLLLMLTALLPLAGWATTGPGANTVFTFTWTSDGDNKTAVISGFVDGATKGNITIPATVDFPEADGAEPTTFKVTEIKANAFKDETEITSVVFAASSNLTTIGENAFLGCTGMTSVDFTNATKLTTIAASAFKGTKITALDLSKTKVATVNNLLGTTFEAPAVANTTLTTVKLPKTVTSIVESAFANCTALNDLSFEAADAAVTIYASAFRGTALTELDLSSTKIAEINNLFGTTATIKNTTLETVKFPATVASISGTAFLNCNKLKTLTFNGSANVFTIAAGALTGTIVEVLDLESTKIAIINNLFGTEAPDVANTTLTTVKLPNTWGTIASRAFENCTALTTVSLKPATGDAVDGQTIATLAFNGAPITALNFTGTTVSAIPASLLYDGTVFTKNNSLATVTLTEAFEASLTGFNGSFAKCEALTAVNNLEKTAIVVLKDGEFEGDALLATINTSKITTFGATAFKGCAALTTIDLSKAAILGESTFEASGLTSVSFPKTVAAIPASCFKDCEALATVTFADDYTDFVGIGDYAFAYTAIAEITVPACLPSNVEDGVASKAFGGCEQLKKFTYNPTGAVTEAVVNDNAFLGCSNVVFVTTEEYQIENPVAPKNSKYVDVEVVPETTELTMTKFAKADKYYNKWKNTIKDIKIKKTDAKVYDAYRDEDDGTLNMIQFKPKGGYIYIKKGQVALIISDNAMVNYEAGEADVHTSWVAPAEQILKINDAAVERLDAEADAIGAGFDYIYGWINSATKGTGFGKVTSGKTLPAGTLYLYANEDTSAAAPGLNVVWRDENGNIEEEVTGIDEIFSNVQKNGEMYNLQGVRVNGAAQKGIYIQNGKKFVVK